MKTTNPEVDAFLGRAGKWRAELEKLRGIALGCGLSEELKWGKPCYTFRKKNVVILQPFKEFCALLFTKGALLEDPESILEKPGDNTQAGRRIPFTTVKEIVALEPVLKAYLTEAIEVEKTGLKVAFKKNSEFRIPEEFRRKLAENHDLKTAFDALTPGRQRAYLLYITSAKQSKTRESRIDKCLQGILNGKGLNERG